jgi:GxxExxY protein
MNVHKELGPGLLEKIYKLALAEELRQNGFQVAVEVPVPVFIRENDCPKICV